MPGPASEPRDPDLSAGAPPVRVRLVPDLLACDLRWETSLAMFKRSPIRFLRAPRSSHTDALAIQAIYADIELLPFRQKVIDSLRSQKHAGRQIVLESDLPTPLTQAISEHLRLFDEIETVPPSPRKPRGSAPALVRAMRPHQWLKNLLLLLPLILAHQVTDARRLLLGILAFFAMSFCASAVYILNDLVDLSSDRRHTAKRHRPFASGQASIPAGLFLALCSLIFGLALGAVVSLQFDAMLLAYLVLTTAYTFWLKRRMLIDVMVLAGLYTGRIIAGAVAVNVPLTLWLLAFSMFLFLSLAFVKRYSELIHVEHAGGEDLAGRGYRVSDLRIIESVGPASGYLSVFVFCQYLDSPIVHSLYARPQILWLVAPLLLYWVTRIWFVARRRELHQDPVVYAIADRVSQLTGLLAVATVLAAGPLRP
jgi:4-hydroxybenzoate polyprenyltransferase